jgi:zinc transport system substrate-binding protein
MHVWLDTHNAAAMVDAIADALAEADPARAETYRANAADLQERIESLDAELAERLTPVRDRPFIVFHDAYHYFEEHYGLSPAGSVTVSPDIRPGAARLTELREHVESHDAVCVFAEPQFDPKLVETIVEGTGASAGVLDPLGAELEAGPDLYFAVMRNLADSLRDCLMPSG